MLILEPIDKMGIHALPLAKRGQHYRQEVPKTPSNPPSLPGSPAGELRAPLVNDRAQGRKRPAEEQLEPPAQAGSTMDTEESRKRGWDKLKEVQVEPEPQPKEVLPDNRYFIRPVLRAMCPGWWKFKR